MAAARASWGRHARIYGRILLGFLAAATIVAGPARAEGPPRKAEFREVDGVRGMGFRLDDRRLAPRVAVQMESLSAFGHATQPGTGLDSHVMWEQMNDHVRGRAKSVTRRMVRDQLFRLMRLDRGIESVRSSFRGPEATLGQRDVDFHFGVHSLMPEVGMRYKLRSGSAFSVNLGAAGDVGFRFNADRLERTDFSASYDGEDTYQVRALFSF